MLKYRVRKGKHDHNILGRDFREIICNYRKYTTKAEFFLFMGVPTILSFLVFIYFYFFENSNVQLLEYILDMNNSSITVIAILAGFNTTSLSIIAAGNNKILNFLKRKKLENSSDSILKQLVSFFSFAILVQLIVLVMGVIISVISNNFFEITLMLPFLKGIVGRALLSIFGIVWLSAVIFTIMISIRNATLLYRYVLFIADYDDSDSF